MNKNNSFINVQINEVIYSLDELNCSRHEIKIFMPINESL